jgi:predicted nucleotidyltransferase
MVATTLPRGVIERIVEVLDPEEVWLFGSRARETHGPDSDWGLMAVLPNTAASLSPSPNVDDLRRILATLISLHDVARAELLAT